MEAFARLIALPSVSSVNSELDQGNRAVVELLGNWLEDLGFAVELMPLAAHPDKLNLIATLGRGPDALILSGHTDTVPYDAGAWSSDPFTLSERDGRLYGLGSADMKCFFPLVMEVARGLDPSRLRRPLVVLATADEETSMNGAKALVAADRRLGRYALIGEPTGLVPVNMHKGVMMERINLIGRSGHSSDPSLGINALEGMHAAIGALLDWRGQMQSRFRNEAFRVPVPTLNLGHIHGGDNPNRICASCELHIDLRLLPGMEPRVLHEELRTVVTRAIEGQGLQLELEPLMEGVPPMLTAEESAIVRTCERLSGHPAGTVAFGTEGPFLNALGMDTVVLGPGDIEVAHQPDEYLPQDRIAPMLAILRSLIGEFCLQEKGEHGQAN